MPSLKAIRNRIASVKNTQKITKAMKLVAAARLRRAQDAIIAARPYANRLSEVLADVTARLQLEAADESSSHPLLAKRPIKVARVIVVNSDELIIKAVQTNPGAIGMINVYSINSGVKVLKVDGKLPLESGYLFHGNN